MDCVHCFRKMSTEEKKNLGTALTRLSPEDLGKALEIVAANNPSFQATAQEVDLDMDAQVHILCWIRLSSDIICPFSHFLSSYLIMFRQLRSILLFLTIFQNQCRVN